MRFLLVVLAAAAAVTHAGADGDARWPASLGYVLQADALSPDRAEAARRLARSGRDLLVLDAAYSGGDGGAWTRNELDAMRAAHPRRRVVAYLSIGEAESYRPYWPRIAGGELVLGENPHWPGNYKVRYWRGAWQDIITAQAAALVTQGFDGLYLDIVDAFQHFEHGPGATYEAHRVNPETGSSYRAEMTAFVARVAAAARTVDPAALVIPQNGSELLRDAGFRAVVSGIGLEDLFTLGDAPQDAEHTAQVLDNLAAGAGGSRFVLVIEYAAAARERARAVRRAGELGFTLLLTDRALTTLGTSYAPMGWN